MYKIDYYKHLPISQNIEEIKNLIQNNQVIIISGETGSGKTTQLPKILLDLGYYNHEQIIGHTQPRRVAAKAVANRLQVELENKDIVGYKIRFYNKTNIKNKIKIMTDGILLEEIHQDKLLRKYKAIIIDEAHERSLNIDFILGYLKSILDIRKDLKIIITSATIENHKFSIFFNNAPLINVKGKSYPVDIIYQPIITTQFDDINLNEAIYRAIESCFSIEHGDVLIFLPGEREIKQCINYLKRTNLKRYKIVPFYSRQNEQEQNQVFNESRELKIIVTTNIAETSLTISGISFVIDSGLVKIKRYNHKLKVEQLLVEKISKASAKQRSGRAGRVKSGICVRLYSEEDYNLRQEFTDPEIYRTNLANVILKLINLGINDIENFSFLDKPLEKSFKDGYRLLYQLSAITNDNKITAIGKMMLYFPLDVKLARILATGLENIDIIDSLLIITSFLSIIDPRENPSDFLEKSQEIHKQWADKNSDFISILKLWSWFQNLLQNNLSKKEFQLILQKNFLSYTRLREWTELYIQLKEIVLQQKIKIKDFDYSYNNINDIFYIKLHQNILLGYINNIGQKDILENFYIGAYNKKFLLHPKSIIDKGKWIFAIELIQTSKLYAIMAANILPQWLIPISKHMVKYTYNEPRWDEKRQEVIANKIILLFGIIIAKETINYKLINREESHKIFIKEGIIENKLKKQYSFMAYNQKIINEIESLEQKYRTSLMYIEEDLYNFYFKNIPNYISNMIDFDNWIEKNSTQLEVNKDELLNGTLENNIKLFPDYLINNNIKVKLNYIFNHSHAQDGITAKFFLKNLNQINIKIFDWLVLGLIREKISFIFKRLPKSIRLNIMPLEDNITEFLEKYYQITSFDTAICEFINQKSQQKINKIDIETIVLPNHLIMHYDIIDEKNQSIYIGNNINEAKVKLKPKIGNLLENITQNIEINNIKTWIPELESLTKELSNNVDNLVGYYSLYISKEYGISLKVVDSKNNAIKYSKYGLTELAKHYLQKEIKYIKTKQFNNLDIIAIFWKSIYNKNDILNDSINFIIKSCINITVIPKNEDEFLRIIQQTKLILNEKANIILESIYNIAGMFDKIIKTIENHPLEEEINFELDDLIFPNFLNYLSYNNLQHFPRYLNGIIMRLDKYQKNITKDKDLANQVNEVYEKWYNLIDKLETKHKEIPQELYDFKYKIYELRVSLFAQELKTQYKVSSKRLINELDLLQKEYL
jgi:ATP-dependent helicase HrpA